MTLVELPSSKADENVGSTLGSEFDFFFRDPAMEVVTQGNQTWFVSGLSYCPEVRWREYLSRLGGEAGLCRAWGDVLIVRIDKADNGLPVQVHAWKGLCSGFDLYFGRLDDGRFIVADNFGDVCRRLPASQRSVRPEAVIDHLLFRAVTNEETHIEKIRRLGFGSTVTITHTGEVTHDTVFDSVAPAGPARSSGEYVDAVHDAMLTVMTPLRSVVGRATLFTGGIDSTLNQSYSGSDTVAVNVKPECLSGRWQFQSDYARNAARLAGAVLEEVPLPASETMDAIISAVRMAGLPQRDFHTLLWPSALSTDYRIYLSGERADSLFGGAAMRETQAAFWFKTLFPFLMRGDVPPGWAKPGRPRQVWKTAKLLQAPLFDPRGFVGLRSCGDYTDMEWLTKMFGEEQVIARLEKRVEYVRARVAPEAIPKHPLYAAMMLANWTSLFSVEEVARVRQIAHSYGKSVYAPFSMGPVVRASMAVPMKERFVKNMNVKYILKDLLKRRLPDYPVKQAKGITGLDFGSLYQRGPLSHIFEEYPMPDFVPDQLAGEIRDHAHKPYNGQRPPQFAWPLANLAIWQKEVLTSHTPLERSTPMRAA